MSHVSLVTLAVDDVERAARFYEALGWERSTASVPDVVVFLRGGTVVLSLYGREALAEDAGADGADVTLATNVATPEVVDAFVAAAERAGGTVTRAPHATDWGGYAGTVADPDGHLWEIAHNPGFPLEEGGRVLLPDDPGLDGAPVRDPRAELAAFRARVDATPGPTSDELARAAADLLTEPFAAIGALFTGQGNDRIIAAMTALTELGMAEAPASPASARFHAASTLVGSLLSAGT